MQFTSSTVLPVISDGNFGVEATAVVVVDVVLLDKLNRNYGQASTTRVFINATKTELKENIRKCTDPLLEATTRDDI